MKVNWRPQLTYSAAIAVNGLTAETHFAESPSIPSYALARACSSFRMEVHQGDRASFDVSGLQDRSELNFPATYARNTTVYHSEQLLVESGDLVTGAWCILSQWHNTPDVGDASSSPPISIQLDSTDHLVVDGRGSAVDPLVTNPAAQILYTSPSPIVRGRSINLQEEVKFDYAGTGTYKLTLDGAVVVNSTGLVIGFNDAVGVYFKAGIYRGTCAQVLAVQHHNLEISTSTLSGRTTNPCAIPA